MGKPVYKIAAGLALAQTLVAVIALIAGLHHAPYMSVREILGFNGFLIVLWIAAALLFRNASRNRAAAGAASGGLRESVIQKIGQKANP